MARLTLPGIDYNWTFRGQAETLVGTFERIYVDGGFRGDGDTNIEIRPDAAHSHLLVNEKGQRNASGIVTCEINVGGPLGVWRSLFNEWVGSLLATTVTARGVYVDDRKHKHTTELHPLDLIMGRVTRSMNRDEDWITNLAAHRWLKPGVDLFAYRYAAASDDRQGFLHHGPPNANTTRDVDLPIQLPPRPASQWQPVVVNRIAFAKNAQSQILGGGPSGSSFRLEARCSSAAGSGPGIVVGEIVAYWKNPVQAEIAFEPQDIRFGTVEPFDRTTRRLRIRNVGSGPLRITVPRQGGAGSVFTWAALNAVTIQPNGSLDVTIEFAPRQAGVAQTLFRVQTDAIGPRSVNVTGTGKAGIPK
jgi:hypothetical protein